MVCLPLIKQITLNESQLSFWSICFELSNVKTLLFLNDSSLNGDNQCTTRQSCENLMNQNKITKHLVFPLLPSHAAESDELLYILKPSKHYEFSQNYDSATQISINQTSDISM